MKKLYTILVLGASCLAGNTMKAQCGLALTTSAPTVCAGDNVTITANATPPVNSSSLTTTFSAGNNHRGNMFDIYATNTVTIDSFDAHPMGNTTIEIYYRPGSYSGFVTSSAGWTLVGSAAVTANPTGTPTPIPVAVNVTIPAGQTYAFYVTSSNTSVSLNYSNGTTEGATYASDANIIFREGVGLEYPFTNGTGGIFTPRIWNGVIHYSTPIAATYTYLWNTTETTSSINTTVNATTQYSVQVDVTGCPTMYDTINVTVSAPPVNAGQDVAVCAGTAVTLSGSGAVSYSWDNSVTDNTPFTPVATNSYIVTGTDSIGCTATDTVTVTVNSLPSVNAGSDVAVCAGDSLMLAGSGAVSYSWDNSVIDNMPFVPAASMSYIVTGTDVNGCMNTDTVSVTVNPLPVVSAGNDVTVCGGSSVVLNGSGAAAYSWNNNVTDGVAFVPATSGSYIVTGMDANGCTAMDTVNVTVNNVNVTTSFLNETILAAANNAQYQWIDCNGNTPIAGANSQTFTASSNGSFAVIITENGCTDTSSCTTISSVGIEQLAINGEVTLYPNPASTQVTVTTGAMIANEIAIVDLTGKTVFAMKPAGSVVTIDLSAYANGVYFVRVMTADGVRTEKVVKQ